MLERTDHIYDADGHVVVVCPPREFTDGAGTCSTSLPDYFSTHSAYDLQGRVSSVSTYRFVNGSALTATATYDADGNSKVVTDANGHTTTYGYDVLDHKVSETRQRDASTTATTTYIYDAVGNTSAVVRPGNPYTGTQADGALVVDGAQHPLSSPLVLNGTKNYTNVTLQNGAWITTSLYSQGGGSLQIFASGTVSICNTCGIVFTGVGAPGGSGGTALSGATAGSGGGPGQPGALSGAQGGGGGGGGPAVSGATGGSSTLSGAGGAGGATYGPVDLIGPLAALVGSGGGGGGAGGANAGGNGGAGGGFLHITAANIDIEGIVHGDGMQGAPGASTSSSVGAGGGGGGSGGSVWLSAPTVTVGSSGTVTSVGGFGGGGCCESGGGGGAGMVRIDANTVTGSNRVVAGSFIQRQTQIITDYTYDADNRVVDTFAGADSTNRVFQGAPTGGSNVHTRVTYDPDGNVVQQFPPNAFLAGNPDLRFLVQTDYDVDDRPITRYVPRYDTSTYSDEGLSATQSSQCPTSSAYQGASGTGVCVTSTSYDSAGNVKQVVLPTATGGNTNRVVNYTYSDDHLLTSVDAPAPPGLSGRVTAMTYSYDGDGKQWLRTDANGVYVKGTFYSDELLRTTTGSANGSVTHVTSYVYDPNGYLRQLTDPLGHTSTRSYSTDSKVGDTVDAAGDDTRYLYDNVGNVTSVYSPSAVAGENNNPFVGTTGIGAPTVNTYTYDNLLLTTTQPVVVTSAGAQSQRRTAYTYDLGGRKVEQDVSTVNASGQQALVGSQTFSYYSDDRLATQTGHDGSVISTQYDPDGNRTSVSDSTSQRTVASTYYLDGSPRSTDEGNPSTADGGRGQRYTYDGIGQIAAVRNTLDGSSTVYNTTYSYGDGEQLASMISDVENGGSTTYTYDAGSRLTGENDPNGQHAQVSYNADGTLSSKVLSQSGTAFASWCYAFNGDYQQTQQTFNQSATACSGGTAYNFGYDAASRLNSFQIGTSAAVSIPHDHDGNRLSYISPGGPQTAYCYHADDSIDRAIPGTTTQTCAPNAAPAGTQTFSYTGYGQVSGDGVNSYCYDGFDRLTVSVQSTSVNCASPAASASLYTYDGLDRQISHRDPNASGATAVHYEGLSSSPVFESIFGKAETVYAVDPMGHDTALQAEGSSTSTQYLVTDGFGNVGAVEGATPSSPVCGERYDPFGTVMAAGSLTACTSTTSTATGNTPDSLYFRGGRRDPSTGDYSLGSRVYDPSKDSFLSPDTYRRSQPAANLGVGVDPLTANTYAYVNGDPVNLVDPSGHNPCTYEGTGAGGCTPAENRALGASDRGANTSGSWAPILTDQGLRQRTYGSQPSPSGTACGDPLHLYNGVAPACDVSSFDLPDSLKGLGVLQINAFIQHQTVCAGIPGLSFCDRGDNRSFDPNASLERSRAVIYVDLNNGYLYVRVNPTCTQDGGTCTKPFPISHGGGSPNDVSLAPVGPYGDQLGLGARFTNPQVKPPVIQTPPIQFGAYLAAPLPGEASMPGEVAITAHVTSFPSFEAYQLYGGGTRTLFQHSEAWNFIGGPNWLLIDQYLPFTGDQVGNGLVIPPEPSGMCLDQNHCFPG